METQAQTQKRKAEESNKTPKKKVIKHQRKKGEAMGVTQLLIYKKDRD